MKLGLFYLDLSEIKLQLLNSISELIFELNGLFSLKYQELLKRINHLFQILEKKLLMEPKNLDDYLLLKNYLVSDTFIHEKDELHHEIHILTNLKNINDEFHVEIEPEIMNEILLAEKKEKVIWDIKIEVERKIDSLKPKFGKILEERSQM